MSKRGFALLAVLFGLAVISVLAAISMRTTVGYAKVLGGAESQIEERAFALGAAKIGAQYALASLAEGAEKVEEPGRVLIRLHRGDAVDGAAVLDRLGHLGRLLLDAVVREDVDQREEVDLALRRRGPGGDGVDVAVGVDAGGPAEGVDPGVSPGGDAGGVGRGEGDAGAAGVVVFVA